MKRIDEVVKETLMLASTGIPEKGVEIILGSGKVIRSDWIPPFDVEYDPEDPDEEERNEWVFNLEEEMKNLCE